MAQDQFALSPQTPTSLSGSPAVCLLFRFFFLFLFPVSLNLLAQMICRNKRLCRKFHEHCHKLFVVILWLCWIQNKMEGKKQWCFSYERALYSGIISLLNYCPICVQDFKGIPGYPMRMSTCIVHILYQCRVLFFCLFQPSSGLESTGSWSPVLALSTTSSPTLTGYGTSSTTRSSGIGSCTKCSQVSYTYSAWVECLHVNNVAHVQA